MTKRVGLLKFYREILNREPADTDAGGDAERDEGRLAEDGF